MKTVALFASLLLAGCAGWGSPSMSADQIKEAVKDKTAGVVCVKATGPWGTAVTTFVNVDKSVVWQGGVTTDAECKITFENNSNKGPNLNPVAR